MLVCLLQERENQLLGLQASQAEAQRRIADMEAELAAKVKEASLEAEAFAKVQEKLVSISYAKNTVPECPDAEFVRS